jgi:hypothetical protein
LVKSFLGHTKKTWLSRNNIDVVLFFISTLLGPVNFASPVMSSTWERSRFLDRQLRSWREQEKQKKANVKALISLLELRNLNHEMI